MQTGDGQIIRQCLSGESEAFGLLVDKYKSSIYAFVYAKVGNFHDAEDLTQEIFIAAYENLGSLRRWDNFFAWLYSIASNRCKNFHRQRKRRADLTVADEIDSQTTADSAWRDYRNKLKYESLHDALATLPEIYRQVLTLYYMGGLKSREIARFLGTSKNTVESRLRRAKSYLKGEMRTKMQHASDEMTLQPAFTFRIVEAIKQTKVKPIPRTTPFPLSLSVTGGLILILLSLSYPASRLSQIGGFISAIRRSQTQVQKAGMIAVDLIEITDVTFLSSERGNGDRGHTHKLENRTTRASSDGKWLIKTQLPQPRMYHSASVVDGVIYVIGGELADGGDPPVEAYNPMTDTWTKKADMPTPRNGLSTCVVDGKIYAIGGIGGQQTVEIYDPKTDRWAKRANMPTPRSNLATSVVNRKIYAIGGFGGPSVVEAYDPMTDRWMKKTDMPTPKHSLSACVVNGKIYAIGGAARGRAVVEAYDPATDTWTRKADMPTPRYEFAMSVANGLIYAVGGWGTEGRLSTVEAYDSLTDTWVGKPSMPTARVLLSTSTVDSKIYAIGGSDIAGSVLATVEVYDQIGLDRKPF